MEEKDDLNTNADIKTIANALYWAGLLSAVISGLYFIFDGFEAMSFFGPWILLGAVVLCLILWWLISLDRRLYKEGRFIGSIIISIILLSPTLLFLLPYLNVWLF